MKNKFFAVLASVALVAVLFTSCAKVPQAEIDAANAAIEMAKAAGADIYAPEALVTLQDSLNGVMVDIEAQKSKFMKNYSSAKTELANVALYAQEVAVQAETRKEEVKAEIQSAITEANALIESNRQLILEAPKGKEGNSALLAIKDEIATIESSIMEANTMFESGDYMATLDKAMAAKEKASAINAELTEVIAKFKGNVRK